MRLILAAVLAMAVAPTLGYAQDATLGEKVFVKCKACHQVGETAKNGVGPQLNGIVGRPAASSEGFNYSPAMKNANITWTEAELGEYLKSPKTKIPGNKMVFVGLTKPEDIANIIAYLKQYDAAGKKTQ